jgi:hypothetical protein
MNEYLHYQKRIKFSLTGATHVTIEEHKSM